MLFFFFFLRLTTVSFFFLSLEMPFDKGPETVLLYVAIVVSLMSIRSSSPPSSSWLLFGLATHIQLA